MNFYVQCAGLALGFAGLFGAIPSFGQILASAEKSLGYKLLEIGRTHPDLGTFKEKILGGSPLHTGGAADAGEYSPQLKKNQNNYFCKSGDGTLSLVSDPNKCSASETARLVMDFGGFGEVILSKSNNKTCSGVLVGEAIGTQGEKLVFLLTAAHCVAAAKLGPNKYVAHANHSGSQYFLPVSEEPISIAICIKSNPQSCAKGKQIKPAALFDGTLTRLSIPSLAENGPEPHYLFPDIALITLSVDKKLGISRFADIGVSNPALNARPRLTQVGYGVSDDPKAHAGDGMSGGRPAVVVCKLNKASGAVQLQHAEKCANLNDAEPVVTTATKACSGDSGGPVFDGMYSGAESQKTHRSLFGLISGGTSGSTTTNCLGSKVQIVQTLTPEVFNWICKTEGTIYGCPGAPK